MNTKVLVRVTTKESKIIVVDSDNKSQKMMDRFDVHRVGPDVQTLKEGDRIVIPDNILFMQRPGGKPSDLTLNARTHVTNRYEDPESKFVWFVVDEEDIKFRIE